MQLRRCSKSSWRTLFAGWCLLAPPLLGCSDLGYAIYAARGQLDLVGRAEPIQDVLDSDRLTDEQRAKVSLILDIRAFAADDLGLNAGNSYTTYVDTGGEPVGYNLSASAKDSLTPVTWTFPFYGTTPYLGFFNREDGAGYQSGLADQGYDTVLYPIASYSTGGFFPDPVTTAMLSETEIGLADLIVHELTHATIWRSDDVNFGENLAMFVARVGAIAYLTSRHGADAPIVEQARQRYADAALYQEFLTGLSAQMREYYASNLSSEEKIAGRTVLFEQARQGFFDEVQPRMQDPAAYDWIAALKFNNAWLLLNDRYNGDLSVFDAVYESAGHDFPGCLQIFREAAEAADPIAYLRGVAATK